MPKDPTGVQRLLPYAHEKRVAKQSESGEGVAASVSIVETLDYYPYGGARIDSGSYSSDRKYIGQQYSAAAQIYYLNARYYDQNRGQFLSQDPMFLGNPKNQNLGDPQSLNAYSYAEDNPISNEDPSGKINLAQISATLSRISATLQSISASLANAGSTFVGQVGQTVNQDIGVAASAMAQSARGAYSNAVNNPILGVGVGFIGAAAESYEEEDLTPIDQELTSIPQTLYHYTSNEGLGGILEDQAINPSDAGTHGRMGTGQYFTDIAPEEVANGNLTTGQVSARLYGAPWYAQDRLESYVQINTEGLNILQNSTRPNVYFLQSTVPLDIEDRIVDYGPTNF